VFRTRGAVAGFHQVGRSARVPAAFRESAVRAYKMMMAPPQEPVLVTMDIDLQEEPIHEEKLSIPKLILSAPPQADEKALREAAKMLVPHRTR